MAAAAADSTQHQSKAAALLWMRRQMHAACEEDSEKNNGVIKAARMAGFLSFLPQADTVALRPAGGPEWKAYDEGSSRLNKAVLSAREAALNMTHYCPVKPDWKQLRDLRRRQQQRGRAAAA